MQEDKNFSQKKIDLVKEDYRNRINKEMSRQEIMNIGAEWYEEVNKINLEYGNIQDVDGLDNVNAYFIACEILGKLSNKVFFSDESDTNMDDEKCKEVLAGEIAEYVMNKRTTKILVFEPHHDDYMGSASTVLYADPQKIQTVVYTMAKSDDDRDNVDLSNLHNSHNVPSKKKTTVIKHIKCDLEDFHYDLRYEITNEEQFSDATTYEELVQYCIQYDYPAEKLSERIKKAFDEFRDVVAKDKYVLLPLGLQHPMHILTAYYGVIEACDAGLSDKILFYVEHPYDFFVKETDRLVMAKEYYNELIRKEYERKGEDRYKCKYVLADGIGHRQREIAEILKKTYTECHYSEFSGSLEKTVCSYLIPQNCLKKLEKVLPLHVNNVLYATFQARPFLKTGGLGEVAYSYIKSLSPFVNTAGIILPKYKKLMRAFSTRYRIGTKIDEEYFEIHFTEDGKTIRSDKASNDKEFDLELMDYNSNDIDFKISLGNTERGCKIEKFRWNGVNYYLLNIEGCFEADNVFDHSEIEKDCVAFNLAVMESLNNVLDFMPTIIHCNDYQTALIPFLIKNRYANFADILKTVYTVHFYGYKGIFSKEKILNYLEINDEACDHCLVCRKNEDCYLNSMNAYSAIDIIKLGIPDDKINLMKVGITNADIVTTVSKGYAATVQNYPDFKGVKVHGICNGVTLEEKNLLSEKDHIAYIMPTEGNWESAKKHNKEVFQNECGLEKDTEIPMFCMVSRLNATKGIEDIKNTFSKLMELNLQLVIIGDDDKNTDDFSPYAKFFEKRMEEYPKKFFYSGYTEELEFKAYSASDVLLMPSRNEACGTTQILAMKYGVLPIVSMLDSFRDTVIDYNSVKICTEEGKEDYVEKSPDKEDKGVGFFCFSDDCWVLLDIVEMLSKKLRTEEKEEKWKKAVNSTISVDFSWYNNSIREYLELYDGFLEG